MPTRIPSEGFAMMSRYSFRWVALAAVASVSFLAGCQHSGSYDLPARYIPEPAGTRQAVLLEMQATKGERGDFVVYNYAWVPGETVLGDYGQRQVRELVPRIPREPFPLLIEPSGDSKLDHARREALVEHLLIQGIEDAEAVVVVRQPTAHYLYGGAGARHARTSGYLN